MSFTANSHKGIKILTQIEIDELYALPKFSPDERLLFFSLNNHEKDILGTIQDFPTQVHFILQIGYFKAKRRLFHYHYQTAKEDVAFIIERFFPGEIPYDSLLHKAKKQQNNVRILKLWRFKVLDQPLKAELIEHAILLVRRHRDPTDIFKELLSYFDVQNIVLPDYTVVQDTIRLAISTEQRRLDNKLSTALTPDINKFLEAMLSADTPLGLNAFKKIPKNFGYMALKEEVEKEQAFKPVYLFAKTFLKDLDISQSNIKYYATVAEQYNIAHLKKLRDITAKLYLLCYITYRYQQINDNLITCLHYYVNKFSEEAAVYATEKFLQYTRQYQSNVPKVSHLLRFMSQDESETMVHHTFYEKIYEILPKEEYQPTADYLEGQCFDHEQAHWDFYVKARHKIKKYLRPIIKCLALDCNRKDDPLMLGIRFIQQALNQTKNTLKQTPYHEFPKQFIPKDKRKYLEIITQEKLKVFDTDKYEIFTCFAMANALNKIKIYCEESTQHKSLKSDLLSDAVWEQKEELLIQMSYPHISGPIDERLDKLEEELHDKILAVNKRIAEDENKEFKIKQKKKRKEARWHLTYPTAEEAVNSPFFKELMPVNITDLMHYVNQRTQFFNGFHTFKNTT